MARLDPELVIVYPMMSEDTVKLIETIKKRMDAIKPSDPHIVYIKGGLNVPYGEVVKVINAIRDAGFDQLGLVSEKKKPGEE